MKAAIFSLAASALVLSLGLAPFSRAAADAPPAPATIKASHQPILLARVLVVASPIEA